MCGHAYGMAFNAWQMWLFAACVQRFINIYISIRSQFYIYMYVEFMLSGGCIWIWVKDLTDPPESICSLYRCGLYAWDGE